MKKIEAREHDGEMTKDEKLAIFHTWRCSLKFSGADYYNYLSSVGAFIDFADHINKIKIDRQNAEFDKKIPKIDYSKNRHLLRYDLSGVENIEKYTVMNNTFTVVQNLREKLVQILAGNIDYDTQIALSNAFNDAEKDEEKQIVDFAIECVKDKDIQQLNKEDRYDENVENFVKYNYNKTYK